MSLSPAQSTDTISSFDLEGSLARGLRSPWLSAAILVAAVIQQALGHVNCDTSWFMTFADKVLDGSTAYVDVSDPNPPAAFLIYMPALVLARALHLPPEAMVDGITFVAALLSIVFAGRILQTHNLLSPDERVAAFSLASFVLLVVPAFCFAEREHFVVILLLPFLAASAARGRGDAVAPIVAIAVGIAAGLALAFKPYYAVPIGLVALCPVVVRREWRQLFAPELLAAAAIMVAYVAVIAWIFPAFFSLVLPVATAVYAAAREAWGVVLLVPAFLANLWLVFAIIWVAGRRNIDPRVLVLCAASIGFLTTYLVQSKGWINHAYPGLAFALLAGGFIVLTPNDATDASRRRRFALFALLPGLIVAPLLFGAAVSWSDQEEFPGLRAEVERLAPSHPSISALSEELYVGHPLVRQVHGRWVGRENCLWLSYAVRYLLARDGALMDAARRARLLQLKAQDEEAFAEDVRRGQPDVLLVETPALEQWARQEGPLSRLFEPYRLAGHAGLISIWLRRES